MARILVLGVNPFEDLPGYQLLSLLKSQGRHEIIAADDSVPALRILSSTGTEIQMLVHPSHGARAFSASVAKLCAERQIDVILPGTDAHLFALAQFLPEAPELAAKCPTLEWLSSKKLANKRQIQDWFSSFARTPHHWSFDDENDAERFASESRYPLMVKGLRKGAVRCNDPLEAVVARRSILRNPANQGDWGGVYAEAFVEGEEHSLFILSGARGHGVSTFSFKKLAMTQLGTTVAAKVDRDDGREVDVPGILDKLTGPTVLELEWRKDASGHQWVFEINVRFPSWIGALGLYGMSLLDEYIERVLGRSSASDEPLVPPAEGTIFYRLPQSGYLPLDRVFHAPHTNGSNYPRARYGSKMPLLWASASPHQFYSK